jgi:hypothetical protein
MVFVLVAQRRRASALLCRQNTQQRRTRRPHSIKPSILPRSVGVHASTAGGGVSGLVFLVVFPAPSDAHPAAAFATAGVVNYEDTKRKI